MVHYVALQRGFILVNEMFDQCWFNVGPASKTVDKPSSTSIEPTMGQRRGFDILLFSSIGRYHYYTYKFTPLLPLPVPDKHDILKRLWVNVGPASATLAQHSPIIVSKPSACWIPAHHPDIILILHMFSTWCVLWVWTFMAAYVNK